MEDNLIELLSTFGFPIYRQGTFPQDESYPSDFFTFWNSETEDHAFYDNNEYGTVWTFNVNFYSNNVENTYSFLAEAKKLLKKNGWIAPGKGYDVASDEPSHTGRGIEIYYLEF